MKPRSFTVTGLLLAGLALLAGCNVIPPTQPDATRYYVLTTAVGKSATVSPAGPHWRVALRPVEMPGFLKGKPMQVRVAGNELQFVDEARWAESLEAAIGRVLRESLEGRGEISHVVASAGEEHDFDIAVRVQRCEGDREHKLARFAAVVEIYSPGAGSERRARDTFTVEIPGWDGSYGDLAQKLSEAVDGLGDRIVTAIPAAEKH